MRVLTLRMMALSTSASSGLTTKRRSASVLDGATCNSGTISPVVGRRYWTRLWWLSSSSSSTRTPVARKTSTTAHAQKEWSSSLTSSRRSPVAGSSAQTLPVPERGSRTEQTRSAPAALKLSPGRAERAASRRAAVVARRSATVRTRTGRTGRRSRVRASMRALRWRVAFLRLTSSAPTGQGATQWAQRPGSSTAQWARSK